MSENTTPISSTPITRSEPAHRPHLSGNPAGDPVLGQSHGDLTVSIPRGPVIEIINTYLRPPASAASTATGPDAGRERQEQSPRGPTVKLEIYETPNSLMGMDTSKLTEQLAVVYYDTVAKFMKLDTYPFDRPNTTSHWTQSMVGMMEMTVEAVAKGNACIRVLRTELGEPIGISVAHRLTEDFTQQFFKTNDGKVITRETFRTALDAHDVRDGDMYSLFTAGIKEDYRGLELSPNPREAGFYRTKFVQARMDWIHQQLEGRPGIVICRTINPKVIDALGHQKFAEIVPNVCAGWPSFPPDRALNFFACKV